MKTVNQIFESFKNRTDRGIYFADGIKNDIYISYNDLYRLSLNILLFLQQKGVKRGDEVLFQINDNKLFLGSFWACVAGGFIAVPINTGNKQEIKKKIINTWAFLNSPWLLSERDIFNYFNDESNTKNLFKDRVIFIEEHTVDPSLEIAITDREPEDLVYLQFSSGSTGNPKGICLTSTNLIWNIRALITASGNTENDKIVSWLPLTHDMGLLGVHFLSCMLLIDHILIPPNTFIRNPQIWLQKANDYKATILYSPNFGYNHFLKHFNKDTVNWDLSNIRIILNGAEPISYSLAINFINELTPFGLPENALRFVYGLAEATLAVSVPPQEKPRCFHVVDRTKLKIGNKVNFIDKNAPNAAFFVEEGPAVPYLEICIMDGQKQILESECVGHVYIRGINVTKGYYNNAAAYNDLCAPDGWFNTGDIGFLKDGNLTITGRYKDIIFINGINYYSNDLENIITEAGEAETGNIVVIGVSNEFKRRDDIIVFLKEKDKLEEKFLKKSNKIRLLMQSKAGIPISRIIPVNSIPKTTSGKLERYKLRQQYIEGCLDKKLCEIQELIEYNSLKRLIDSEVIEILEMVLDIKPIKYTDDLFSLGAESINIVTAINEIEHKYDIRIPIEEVIEDCMVEKIVNNVTTKFFKQYIEHGASLM